MEEKAKKSKKQQKTKLSRSSALSLDRNDSSARSILIDRTTIWVIGRLSPRSIYCRSSNRSHAIDRIACVGKNRTTERDPSNDDRRLMILARSAGEEVPDVACDSGFKLESAIPVTFGALIVLHLTDAYLF
jgi:hypothetical protein